MCVGTGYRRTPNLISKIGSRKTRIVGVAVLNDKIYVVRTEESSIEVYHGSTFAALKGVAIPDMKNPQHMVSCSNNKCLYICNVCNTELDILKSTKNVNAIFKIGPAGINQWPLELDRRMRGCPKWISVNSKANVLVTYINEIREYSTNGGVIQIISYKQSFQKQLGLTNIISFQAVQSIKGNYYILISSAYEAASLFLYETDASGIVSFWCCSRVSNKMPLAVSSKGEVFALDETKNCILSSNRSSPLKFDNKFDMGLFQVDCAMYLDENSGRLYVGTNGGQLLVFKVSKEKEQPKTSKVEAKHDLPTN